MPYIENKRDEAVLKWVKENRPNLIDLLEDVLAPGTRLITKQVDNLYLILSIGFEAGRQFQRDNPENIGARGAHVDSSR